MPRKIGLSLTALASYMLSGMDPNKTTLERAFEIAAAGTAKSVPDICVQLKAEGYDGKQIEGRSLKNQLREILEKAKADAART